MMTLKSVAISGASSFTGIWIANEFNKQGFQVNGLLREASFEHYLGLKRIRVNHLLQNATPHFGICAEDGSMVQWIRENRPQIWIHHHHHMDNFRGSDYDENKSLQTGIAPLASIVTALKESGCKGVIFSGSYFEPGEGGKASADILRTPYSNSKKVVWEELEKLCQAVRLPLSKVVIPNPIGPFENEDRVIPLMIKKSHDESAFPLFSPDSVSDNIPVTQLAKIYLNLAQALLIDGQEFIARPSGWIATALEFVTTVNKQLIANCLHATPCLVENKPNGKPAMCYENERNEKIALDLSGCWGHYADELRNAKYLVNES